ncbi:glycosyltransferase [Streptomyces sp. NBC_00683]|uniref:glycosyltransferase n=1 Tax=Streptomyces sp. NBC_00683 TaxID=2903670 RepID=UPI002E342C76|nr:glycosyltransferase [Streptomyces sp. NBC_00683]
MNGTNPYQDAGGGPAAPGFIDRPDLVAEIESVWRSPGRPRNLSVVGQLLFGKTSVVEQALRRVNRADLAVVRVSVVELDSVFGLFRTLTSEVTTRFPGDGELNRLNATAQSARGWYDLRNAVTSYFEMVAQRDLHVLLVLDEFDRAPWVLVDLSAYQLLRSLVSERKYSIGVVTISRRSVFEIEADAAGGSRLDGVMSLRCHVGLLEPEEATSLLGMAGKAGVDLRPVESELLARCGRHAYLLGIVCRRMVDEFHRTGSLDVLKALELEAGAFHAYFDRLIEEIDLDLSGRGTPLLHTVASGGPVSELPALDEQTLVNKGVLLRGPETVRLFSDEFAAYLRTALSGTTVSRSKPHDRYRCTALVVATEWASGHGGLSTFNREFCRALARLRVRVLCLVLNATDAEVAAAKDAGVTLLPCRPVAGADEMASLMRPLQLPGNVVPELVIGHGRITGPAAQVQAEHFQKAKPKTLHFVHMDPDETEWHKLDRRDDAMGTADSRKRIEVSLGRDADRLVAVGPRLHGLFLGHLSRRDDTDPLRFDPGFDLTDTRARKVPDGTPLTVLLIGRTEDWHLKGLDLAAAACGRVAGWRREAKKRAIELVVRGVPEEQSAEQTQQLIDWAGDPRLRIVPRPYTTEAEHLQDDLIRASLLIMPSRAEGFGLVGQEAIVEGTPVLVSETSGLGELLREELGNERAASWVVPMSGGSAADIETWARLIDGMLTESEQKFIAAEALRVELAEKRPWSRSVEELLTAMGL